MPQLLVRDIEEKVVRKLKQRAGEHGVSMEEELRRILRETLLPQSKPKMTIKDYLLTMPDLGDEKDFERQKDFGRDVEL